MDIKALRRPHERGWTTQLITPERSRRHGADASWTPGPARLVGRWTTGDDGHLRLTWVLEPRRPGLPMINRTRGSDV
jgi:hypothetical protein